ncbi:MAG: hypothetical protein QM638_08015 [Nocardioides sp.]|uniref:hypothetical protein n=1 Tax=Nocardioides sp. TaxID=35761 RepID=UPI0039E5014F
MSDARPFASALGTALERRRMSLGELHRSLQARGTPVSMATLSYWRSGRSEPEQRRSLHALAEIEEILRLDPGELESLLDQQRRRRLKPEALSRLSDRHEVIRRLLGDLDFESPSDELIDREVTIKYDLDAAGAPRRCTYIVVVEGLVDGACRRAMVLRVEAPGAPMPTITPLGGYRLGRIRHDAESGFVVAEMLLDRELYVGDTALLEQQIDYQGIDPDDNEFFYWAVRKMTSASLWIRFDPRKVPARCESYTVLDGVEHVEEVETFGTGVSRTVTNFGPGTMGFRWYWE